METKTGPAAIDQEQAVVDFTHFGQFNRQFLCEHWCNKYHGGDNDIAS